MQSFISRFVIALITLSVSGELFALLEPSTDDLSIKYLSMIFGGNVGPVSLRAIAQNSIVPALFKNLSWVISIMVVLVISYTVIVSVINTAQEGEIMGKKWSPVWITMRGLLSITLIAPMPGAGGYSLIQVIIIGLIKQAIGAADLMWDIARGRLNPGITVALNNTSNTNSTNFINMTSTKNNAKIILNALTIKNAILNSQNDPANNMPTYSNLAFFLDPSPPVADINNNYASYTSYFYCGVPTTDPNSVEYEFHNVCLKTIEQGNILNIAPFKIEGKVYKKDLSAANQANIAAIARSIYDAKVAGFQAMLNILDPIANKVATNDPAINNTTITNAIQDSAQAYINIINNPNLIPQNNNPQNQFESDAAGQGWAVASTYYIRLSNSQDKENNTIPTPSSSGSASNEINTIEQLSVNNAKENLNQLNNTNNQSSNPTMEQLSGYNGIFLSLLSAIGADIGALLTPGDRLDEDPLMVIASSGRHMMQAAEIAFLTLVALGVLNSLTNGIFTACLPLFLMGGSIFKILYYIAVVLIMLWPLGATLGIITPMIPFVIYTATVVSWFFSVIEVMVASPIIALELAVPSEDEFSDLRPAFFILLGVLLRPVITVFAFYLAILVFKASIELVRYTIGSAVSGMGGGFTSILYPLFFAAGAIYFLIALVTHVFNIIPLLGDKVMRWIGGETGDAARMAGEVSSKTTAKVEKTTQVVNQVMQGGLDETTKTLKK